MQVSLKNKDKKVFEIKNLFIFRCSYADVHNWGLSMHYKGEKCEIRDRTISRSLFILIVTLISSLFVLVVILAALKFYIFKKKTDDKGVTMIYA
jgi:hypothetical protein